MYWVLGKILNNDDEKCNKYSKETNYMFRNIFLKRNFLIINVRINYFVFIIIFNFFSLINWFADFYKFFKNFRYIFLALFNNFKNPILKTFPPKFMIFNVDIALKLVIIRRYRKVVKVSNDS